MECCIAKFIRNNADGRRREGMRRGFPMFRNGMEQKTGSEPNRRQLTRRRVLRDGGALFLSTALSLKTAHADRAAPTILTEDPPIPFDRSTVIDLARQLASSDFVRPQSDDLPPKIAELNYDQYRDIRFDRLVTDSRRLVPPTARRAHRCGTEILFPSRRQRSRHCPPAAG